jgi:hypothetical protein
MCKMPHISKMPFDKEQKKDMANLDKAIYR